MPVGMARQALNDDLHCGDGLGHWRVTGRTVLGIVDGLGHGREAEAAAQTALSYVELHAQESLQRIFSGCDEALRTTRGAAMALAILEDRSDRLDYAAVGNISAMQVGPPDRYFPSTPGVVGAGYRSLLVESVSFGPTDLAVFWTDGLKSVIDMSRYGRASRADLTALAEMLLRDWGRGTDDAAVLVYRNGRE